MAPDPAQIDTWPDRSVATTVARFVALDETRTLAIDESVENHVNVEVMFEDAVKRTESPRASVAVPGDMLTVPIGGKNLLPSAPGVVASEPHATNARSVRARVNRCSLRVRI